MCYDIGIWGMVSRADYDWKKGKLLAVREGDKSPLAMEDGKSSLAMKGGKSPFASDCRF